MSPELEKLRPHPRTGDDAPVSYRAGGVRKLFAEIERLERELASLNIHNRPEGK